MKNGEVNPVSTEEMVDGQCDDPWSSLRENALTSQQTNVFSRDPAQEHYRQMIRQHKAWLESIPHEFPSPFTPYRIGVYIRYFNQTKYENYLDYHKSQFEDTIALCPKWTLVDFYVDEGQSAPNMENAKGWSRLLEDCFAGRIDLIVTQKISNVSRKPNEIAFCARVLATLQRPVGIYFVSEDLFTLASYYKKDMRDSEFFPTSDWEQLPGGECDEGWIEEDETSHDA